VIRVDEMLELGKTCGIEVGCAAASIVEEEI
ncbi:50S ribosomal protein L7, partial [Peptococcaceae bacterium SCADC1_2_3]